jgi:2-polyprenyl-6-methoxyphenol hydroxylase-like FAD-dependent oxidoreductase
MTPEILVVGAGPTGLVLALWLARMGIRLRIIDKAPEAGMTSRALAVHARTLELYRQLDLTESVIAGGRAVPAINLWVQGKPEARVAFEAIGSDLTPYPFLQIFPQDEHERLLGERLAALGISVERRTELLGYTEEADRIVATLRSPKGEERCEVSYLAGCDGAHSIVRQTLGTGFPGGTYEHLFYVADVEAAGPSSNGELHVDLDEADFLAVFPLQAPGHVRLVGTVRDERARHADTLEFDDVKGRAIEHLQLQVRQVNWFSTYHVHHRVTEHFRRGRAFVLGDAAHIHSPAGGQGMNTGIGDAINLAWKLKAVLEKGAPDIILDSYESERIAFARKLVYTTDKVFSMATAEGRIAEIIRTRIVPLVFPAAAKVSAWREWMFRTVSQTTINYRGSWLSAGRAGDVHGGDRLPWLKSVDNYRTLDAMTWQVHVCGEASPDLSSWCKAHELPLHSIPWHDDCAASGFARGALYLLRPDTYVAMADESGTSQVVERYCSDRGLHLRSPHTS